MDKREIADKLHRMILACRKCPDLWKPPVPPEGNLDAKIFLCGRNPGRTEHRLGRPFAAPDAPGGRLLSQELRRISLPRENCWVTNLVCCYSEGDRPPAETEINNCRPYLRVQMLIIRPKLVVAMGKQAGDTLNGRGLVWAEAHGKPRIGELKGDGFKYVLLPTTHPGQALRGRRDELYKDFNVIRLLALKSLSTEMVEQKMVKIVGRVWEMQK